MITEQDFKKAIEATFDNESAAASCYLLAMQLSIEFDLNRLGIQARQIGDSTEYELTLPEKMDWEMAKILLPTDLYEGLRNQPKPDIKYFKLPK